MLSINGQYAESMDEVYEKWLSICDKSHKTHNVMAYRQRFDDFGEEINDLITGFNIATNSADLYYAQSIVGASLTEDYGSASNRCELQNPASADTPAKTDTYSSVNSPIVASRKTITATYPKVNDGDGDNTGAGVDIVTWAYSWLTTDFNTAAANDITGGCIHNAAGSPIAGSDLLSHWNFASAFEKLATDTLKVFLNHEVRGV